jgi:signal transduction histidine kinase
VLALVSIPLTRRISRPVEEITQAARALGAGDLAARAKVVAHGEMGELAQAFNEMAGRIQALLRNERELLANVSHELRTPLARIRMALELAAEGDLERARRYLGEIGTDLGELEQLLEDVLAAARLELAPVAGEGFPLHRAPVEAQSLLDEAAARFRAAQPQRELVLEVEGALPALSADRALLRRVLGNLIDNARKYSDEGQPITIRASASGAMLELEVRDRGIGVEPADLPRLFTPFFRTDRSRARGTGGVGLGLTLARRIVEAHGGTIAFESQVGIGSTVRIRLPAMPTD